LFPRKKKNYFEPRAISQLGHLPPQGDFALFISKEEITMPQDSLRELYIDELRDLYNAETQLVKALPKMAKAASNQELRQAFEEHLRQTSGHVTRLEQIFEELGEKPSGKKCIAMEGLVKEGSELISEDYPEPVLDAGIIGAAQRVEHYEIAAYGTVRSFAEVLGESEQASLLEETLNEEKEADETLSQISERVNPAAAEGEAEQETRVEMAGRQGQGQRKTKSKRAA
jgi:ferritin-like metal-binding protein YciE